MARLTMGVSAAALMLSAGPAFAQSGGSTQVAQSGDVQEIVVTGFRRSILQSVEEKKKSTEIVEAITAEDIGKLPDNSIAESLARLPGLTSQRVDGRSQTISVRGLGPDFTQTLLNGREQVSTSNNRSAEFDQYPSELISSVLVYKSAQAGIVGQGLAGTVDLRTIRPLDYKERVLALSARGDMTSTDKLNPDSDRYGYRLSGVYVDKFAHDTLGIAIGIAHLDQPTQIKDARAWGYPGNAQGIPVIGGAEVKSNSLSLKRTGVTGTIEYEPNENSTTVIDAFYSNFEDEQIQRGIELPLLWSAAQLQPGAQVSDRFVTSGQYTGVKPVLRSDLRTTESEIIALGLNSKYKKGAWTFTGDASYNQISRDSDRTEIYMGTSRGDSTGPFDTIDFRSNTTFGTQFTPRLNYADPNLIRLTSPQGWGGDVVPGGQDGYVNRPSIDDELWAVRGDIDYALDSKVFNNIRFTANYSSREKEFSQTEFYLALRANQADPLRRTSVTIPSQALLNPADLSWVGIGRTVAFNSRYLLENNFYSFIPCPRQDCIINRWSLSEDVLTGAVRADIDATLGAFSVTGNVGLQVVNTDQSSTGPAATNPTAVVVRTDGIEYTEYLPSLNLIFSPQANDDHKVRFALSRQMARPRPDSLRASANISFNPSRLLSTDPNSSPWGGDGGNPRLKPWIANAVDLSYEYYFAPAAYVSVSGFWKDLRSYIYQQNLPFNFAGFSTAGNPEPRIRTGFFSQPANGTGGKLKGLEVALSLPFDTIAAPLEGFGITANVGITETDIAPNGPGSNQPIPGYSKWTPQGTFYYDKNGFSARVSVSHRSKYVAEVRGFGESRDFRRGKEETLVDAQVSYEFQQGALEGLTVLLQGYNLTDEPFVTYDNNDERQIINYQKFGSRYLLGVSYRF